MNLDDPKLYTNREISWLRFNERVLEEARDPNNPLLERVKFLAIVANNLDEFFEIRVAGLLQQMEAGVHDAGPDGLLPEEVFEAVSIETHRMVHEQYACWNEELLPALKKAEVHIRSSQDLEPAEQTFIRDYWLRELHPVLTPLTVNPAHPIPRVVNKSLCLAVLLKDSKGDTLFGVVTVPRLLPRLIRLPREDEGRRVDYVFWPTSCGRTSRSCTGGMRSWAPPLFVSRATATSTSMKKKPTTCFWLLKTNSNAGARAIPSDWKSTRRRRSRSSGGSGRFII